MRGSIPRTSLVFTNQRRISMLRVIYRERLDLNDDAGLREQLSREECYEDGE